jgi:hypothetical protein
MRPCFLGTHPHTSARWCIWCWLCCSSSSKNSDELVQWSSRLFSEGSSRKLRGRYRIQHLFWSRLGSTETMARIQYLPWTCFLARALPVFCMGWSKQYRSHELTSLESSYRLFKSLRCCSAESVRQDWIYRSIIDTCAGCSNWGTELSVEMLSVLLSFFLFPLCLRSIWGDLQRVDHIDCRHPIVKVVT